MSAMRPSPVAVARESVIFAAADMKATYTWRTYLFGWLLRLLLQTIFFSLAAGYFGTRITKGYALVGNAVILGCLESMVVVLMMVKERSAGTLPLLATAPTSHVPIYLGRGVQWMTSGMVSSTLAFVALPPLLGVSLPWPRAGLALPLLGLTCVTSYCYGCALGALAVEHMSLVWLLLNLGYLPIMAFCGVNVPVSFWPWPLHAIVEILPITHGLMAIRGILADASAASVITQIVLEAIVGMGWLLAAGLALEKMLRRGIATGNLEFGD